MKTRFRNLFYLKKTLNKLTISHELEKNTSQNLKSLYRSLIIPQSNGYNPQFCWNGQEYELVADMMYWEQTLSPAEFISKVGQQYAGEVIIGESQKIGFQPIKYQQNSDGSTTLVLQRWQDKKLSLSSGIN